MRHRAPGYYQMIKDPQDLSTIRSRLEADKYKRPADVSALSVVSRVVARAWGEASWRA